LVCVRSYLGKAEIQNLGMTSLGDKDIGRLNVAMYDPFGVCWIQRIGDLDRDRE
jgi:hypothetical protein